MEARHILVPADLSEDGARALEPVSRLAQRLGARLILLHVVADLLVDAADAHGTLRELPTMEERRETARLRLAELARRVPEGVPVELAVRAGDDVAAEILAAAAEHGADAIALSSHGRTGFRRLVLGSVAEKVLRHSRVPVVVYPRRED